jgi:DNA polymerase III sliding clamp (beta) subunit (PCNA family)
MRKKIDKKEESETSEKIIVITPNLKELYTAINSAFICAYKYNDRQNLQGICFDVRETKTYILGSDGHRLSKYDLVAVPEGGTGSFLLDYDDTKSLLAILKQEAKGKLDYPVRIEIGSNVKFKFLMSETVVRFGSNEFPPWERIIDSANTNNEPCNDLCLNPFYFADIHKSFGIKKSDENPRIIIKTNIIDNDDIAGPVRFTSPNVPELTIVIMPVRI